MAEVASVRMLGKGSGGIISLLRVPMRVSAAVGLRIAAMGDPCPT